MALLLSLQTTFLFKRIQTLIIYIFSKCFVYFVIFFNISGILNISNILGVFCNYILHPESRVDSLSLLKIVYFSFSVETEIWKLWTNEAYANCEDYDSFQLDFIKSTFLQCHNSSLLIKIFFSILNWFFLKNISPPSPNTVLISYPWIFWILNIYTRHVFVSKYNFEI